MVSLQMRQPQSDAGSDTDDRAVNSLCSDLASDVLRSDTDDSFRGDLAEIARAVNSLCSDLASDGAACTGVTPYSKPAGATHRVTSILKTPMALASPAGQTEAATVGRDVSKQTVRSSICFTTPGVVAGQAQDVKSAEHDDELEELRLEVAALRKACQQRDDELLKFKNSAAYQAEQQSTIAQLRSEVAAAHVEQAALEHESSELKQRLHASTQQLREVHDALQASEASRHRAEGALQHLAQELEHIKHELEAQAVAAVEGADTSCSAQQQQYKALIAAHQTELQRATAAAEHSASDAAAASRSLAAAKQQTAALEAALQCREEELKELRVLAATVTARCSADSTGASTAAAAANVSSGVARALQCATPSTPGGYTNGGHANGCVDTTPSSDWESVRSNWRNGDGAALSRNGSDAAAVSELAAELTKLKQELSEARSKLDAIGDAATHNTTTSATAQDSYNLAGVRYYSSASSGVSSRHAAELHGLSLQVQRSEDERRALTETLAAVRSAADAAQRIAAHTEQQLQQRLDEAQQQLSDVRADMANMVHLRNKNSNTISGSSSDTAAAVAAQKAEHLEAELYSAKAATRDALQQLAQAQQQSRSLQQAEATLQRSLKQCEQSAQTAAAAAREDYSRVRQRLERTEQQLASLQAQANTAADRCSTAVTECAAVQRELDSAQQRAQQLSEQLQTAAAQRDTALRKLADANECVTAEQKQSAALRTENRSLLAQLDTAERELRQAHSSSAERLASAEAEISTLTAQLQATIAEESRLSAVLQTRAATWTQPSSAAAVIAPCSGDRVGKATDDVQQLQKQQQQPQQQLEQQKQQQRVIEEACAGLEWVISALLATAAATSTTVTAAALSSSSSSSSDANADGLMTQLIDVVKRVRAAAVHGTDSWRKLRTALAADVTALKAANAVLEQQLAAKAASIDSIQQQHSEKIESLLREQRASAVELATAKSELEQLQSAAASHRATATPGSAVATNNNNITNSSSVDASYMAAESPSQCLLDNLRASADTATATTAGAAVGTDADHELRLRHGLVPVQWLAEAKAHVQQLQLQVRVLEQQVTSAASSVPRSTVPADDSSKAAAAATVAAAAAKAAHREAELRVQIRGLQCELQSAVTAQHDAADAVQQLEQQVAQLTAAATTASSTAAVAHSSAIDRELSHVRGKLERVRAKYKAAAEDSSTVQLALTAYRRDVSAAAAALKSTLDVLMCMSSGTDAQQAAAAPVVGTGSSDCSAVDDDSNAVHTAAAEVAGLKDMSEAVYDMLRRVNSSYLQLQQQQQSAAEVTDDRPQLHDHSSLDDSVLNDSTASSDLLDKSCAVAEALEEVCNALYTSCHMYHTSHICYCDHVVLIRSCIEGP
jgi:chromosome segregation ATPase